MPSVGCRSSKTFCKEMADPDIERWRNRGSISIWHYEGFPDNYHGYHLTADAQGCVFLLGLIELFRNAQYPARKVMELTTPTSDHLAIPNCPQKCIRASMAEFRFRREYPDSHWSIAETDGKVIIETGAIGLCELDRGFADVALGKGDWATGDGNSALWFWWHPNPNTSAEQ